MKDLNNSLTYNVFSTNASCNNCEKLMPFSKARDWLEKAINIDASVKAVAAEQDHFERFHNNARFKTLVGL